MGTQLVPVSPLESFPPVTGGRQDIQDDHRDTGQVLMDTHLSPFSPLESFPAVTRGDRTYRTTTGIQDRYS